MRMWTGIWTIRASSIAQLLQLRHRLFRPRTPIGYKSSPPSDKTLRIGCLVSLPNDHYSDPGSDYMRRATAVRTLYEVVHEESLAGRAVEIDHGSRLIRARTGMPVVRYQTGLMRASLYLIGLARGEVWAPEFQLGPASRLSVVRACR